MRISGCVFSINQQLTQVYIRKDESRVNMNMMGDESLKKIYFHCIDFVCVNVCVSVGFKHLKHYAHS